MTWSKIKEVVIDYENNSLLYLIGKSNKTFFEGQKIRGQSSYFQMCRTHSSSSNAKIGKKIFYFGIDTGAEVNVIDLKAKK